MSVAVATAGVGVTLLTIVECVQSTLCAATVPTLCRRCLALVPSFAGCACEVSMLCVAFRGRDIDFSTTHGCFSRAGAQPMTLVTVAWGVSLAHCITCSI